MRSPMILRWISDVPPMIVSHGVCRKRAAVDPPFGSVPHHATALGPSTPSVAASRRRTTVERASLVTAAASGSKSA
jgi:hypothetical protein